MDDQAIAELLSAVRRKQQAFWRDNLAQPVVAIHPQLRANLARWFEAKGRERPGELPTMWGMQIVEDPSAPVYPGWQVRAERPEGEAEVARLLLAQDEPPAGVQITVSMRALWRALQPFGTDQTTAQQTDAFEQLWQQIAAERPDAH